MGLQPKIEKKRALLKTCTRCGQMFGPEGFAPTKSLFYEDGLMPICNDCVEEIIAANDGSWETIDKVCQMADIPFDPNQWEKLRDMNPNNIFARYAEIFMKDEYEQIHWGDYFQAFKKLEEQKEIEQELPGLADDRRRRLRDIWGANYDDEALNYLEKLFNGLMNTQNVNGSLQVDQAQKICKISYEIDCRIRAGEDFDKLLKSYDTLVKAADFTPKNVKNINDFDSVGEIFKWLEKTGWHNKFYDGVTQDVVDETLKNFEGFNQRLYINESNIGEETNRRIESLKNVAEMEGYYNTDKDYDLENFEQQGYDELMKGEAQEEFQVDLEADDEVTDDEW